jgi:hypothetical protein
MKLKYIILNVNSHKRLHIIWFQLYEMSWILKFLGAESRLVVARDWRDGGMDGGVRSDY